MARYKYFAGFHEVLDDKLFNFGWSGEWRQGVIHHKVTAIIDLEGNVPRPLPSLRFFLSWPIHPAIPHMPTAWIIARLGAMLISTGQRVAVACLAGEQRSLWMAGLILREMGYGNGREILDMLHDANPDGPGKPFDKHILSLRRKRISLAT